MFRAIAFKLKITLLEVLEYDSQEAVRQAEGEYEEVKIAVRNVYS